MSLTSYLIEGLLPEEENKKVVAVYGGGFKPPTSGHFEVVKQALKENPEIDEFIILIGGKERDGISPEESLLIWDIYKQYLPIKVRIELSPKPPIQAIYNYAKNHPEEIVLWVIGAREGNDDDFKDISKRTTSLDNYPNMDLRVVITQGGVSGTAARNASKISLEKLKPMLPSELSDEEAEEVFNIMSDKVQEVLTENASYSQQIDVVDKIAQLTNHMIDMGMNIEPLPSMEFVDGDSENAKDFFGKTAYYDPNRQHIVLYTEGRHPKDIVRSYAHEMIHHIQYLEDRLGDVSGTNTTEDDHLDKIEQEANLRGTMTFRNWTDSILNEAIVGDKIEEAKEEVTDSMVAVLSRNDNQINLYDLKTNEALGNINTYGNEVNGVAAKKGYGPLMYELGMANIYPKGLQSDRRGNTEAPAEAVWKKYIEGASPNIKVEKLTPKDRDYRTTYAGDGYDSSYIPDFYNYKFYNPDTTTLKQLIQKGNTLSDELRKKIILDNDKLYNDLVNEAIVGDKIECDNCGWSWNIVDGGDDLFICHKCGHDNNNEQMEKNKDPFGLNQFAIDFANEIAEGVVKEGRYDKSSNQFSKIAFEAFKDIHDKGDEEGTFEFSVGPDDEDIYSDQFEFDFEGYVKITDDTYSVNGGANPGFDEKGDEITPLLNLNFEIPKNPDWQKVSFDIKDVVRHELEHLTQAGLNLKGGAWNEDPKLRRPSKQMADDQFMRDLIDSDLLPKSKYYKLEKELDAMLQGLYFKAKKSNQPFKDVIDDYLDMFVTQKTITQEEKEDILDIWRSRNKALSLPMFENEQNMDYKIFSDMDGVLTDFDGSFVKYSKGIPPREYEKKYGKDGFWKLIDGEGGVGYWAGMPWMEDGKEYWDYIKDYDTELLSSPSRSETSRLGKRLWVKNNMPGVKLTLAQAYNKKNYAEPNHILIDDRESNIEQWREAGGIGILHTSASDTIKQLKALGL